MVGQRRQLDLLPHSQGEGERGPIPLVGLSENNRGRVRRTSFAVHFVELGRNCTGALQARYSHEDDLFAVC